MKWMNNDKKNRIGILEIMPSAIIVETINEVYVPPDNIFAPAAISQILSPWTGGIKLTPA
jgi:hypothetical protein